jgi:predicted phage tail protein
MFAFIKARKLLKSKTEYKYVDEFERDEEDRVVVPIKTDDITKLLDGPEFAGYKYINQQFLMQNDKFIYSIGHNEKIKFEIECNNNDSEKEEFIDTLKHCYLMSALRHNEDRKVNIQ